jgi:hypothetical protein
MLHFIPLPELHLFVEFVECVSHPLNLGSLKFLDGDRPRHIIMYQTPSDVVAKFLCDVVDGGGPHRLTSSGKRTRHSLCHLTTMAVPGDRTLFAYARRCHI